MVASDLAVYASLALGGETSSVCGNIYIYVNEKVCDWHFEKSLNQ